MLWLGKLYWADFVNSKKADLSALENHLNRHPKKACERAIPLDGTSKGFTIILKCRPSEFKGVVDNVVKSVDNTTFKTYTPIGYMTPEDRKRLKTVLTFPPAIDFITLFSSLVGDSAFKAWTEHMNLQAGLGSVASQFTAFLIKAAFVAIWPTFTTLVVIARKKIGI
ncbi:MAG: hypothetical protein WBZ36_29980 [Candidatus Nitrosopolaris sp.]